MRISIIIDDDDDIKCSYMFEDMNWIYFYWENEREKELLKDRCIMLENGGVLMFNDSIVEVINEMIRSWVGGDRSLALLNLRHGDSRVRCVAEVLIHSSRIEIV